MKPFVSALLATLIACACASAPMNDSPPDVRDVAFTCVNGQSLSVRFFPTQETALLMRNGETIELRQQPSGSGFIYSNGPNTIRGKGDELMVEIGRMAPIRCKAEAASGNR